MKELKLGPKVTKDGDRDTCAHAPCRIPLSVSPLCYTDADQSPFARRRLQFSSRRLSSTSVSPIRLRRLHGESATSPFECMPDLPVAHSLCFIVPSFETAKAASALSPPCSDTDVAFELTVVACLHDVATHSAHINVLVNRVFAIPTQFGGDNVTFHDQIFCFLSSPVDPISCRRLRRPVSTECACMTE